MSTPTYDDDLDDTRNLRQPSPESVPAHVLQLRVREREARKRIGALEDASTEMRGYAWKLGVAIVGASAVVATSIVGAAWTVGSNAARDRERIEQVIRRLDRIESRLDRMEDRQ
jgi:hypothetical protein